jgi:hypothetical protein
MDEEGFRSIVTHRELDMPAQLTLRLLTLAAVCVALHAPIVRADDPLVIDFGIGGQPEGLLDGAFLEMMLDFTTDNWAMRLAVNPEFDPNLSLSIFASEYYGLNDQILFAWSAFAAPEPGVLVLMGLGAAMILTPRRKRRRRRA